MDEPLKYPWQHAVVDAFLSPPRDLPTKISIAERSILARLKESHRLDLAEKAALDDGLRALQVLISEARSRPAEYNRGEREDIA